MYAKYHVGIQFPAIATPLWLQCQCRWWMIKPVDDNSTGDYNAGRDVNIRPRYLPIPGHVLVVLTVLPLALALAALAPSLTVAGADNVAAA